VSNRKFRNTAARFECHGIPCEHNDRSRSSSPAVFSKTSIPSAIPKPRLASSHATFPQPILRPPCLIELTTHRSSNTSPWPHAIDALKVSQAVMFIEFPRVSSRRVAAGNVGADAMSSATRRGVEDGLAGCVFCEHWPYRGLSVAYSGALVPRLRMPGAVRGRFLACRSGGSDVYKPGELALRSRACRYLVVAYSLSESHCKDLV
jgi:hypothetical protein